MDEGAARALKKHASLFAAGVMRVTGRFMQQDAVQILDSQGREIAHGLVNYTSEEMDAAKVNDVHHCSGLMHVAGNVPYDTESNTTIT